MSTAELTDAITARARGDDAVYLQRAPNDVQGTYAVIHVDLYGREDLQTQTLDVRVEVNSQTTAKDARDLADRIEARLHGWAPMQAGTASALVHESTQDIPDDQNDPLSTRLVSRYVGVWSSSARAAALAQN